MRTFFTKRNVARTPEEFAIHFWSQVDKSGECWLWTGHVTHAGYGRIRWKDRKYAAHRLAFEMEFGATDQCVLHRCDVRNCVRPSHLFAGTQLENVHDCLSKGRRPGVPRHSDKCLRGHPYTLENTLWLSSGARACRECVRESHRRFKARMRSQNGAQDGEQHV